MLVLAVLTVSYASSLRAYLVQRDHIQALNERIDEREANINKLEREKSRWEDPAFVASQARGLGYVKIGETGFQVLDADGEPLERPAELHDPEDVLNEDPDPWWSTAWESMELAGNPPEKNESRPAEMIDGTKQ